MIVSPQQLADVLDRFAPFRAAPLTPEISVFYGQSLVEVWEAAEKAAGRMLSAPFWAYPWAGGTGLARVILDHRDWFEGRHVLDFGCGGGIAALAAARAGAARVVANDVDELALMTVRIAAERQQLQIETLLADLTEAEATQLQYDFLLCSDLAYEKQVAPKQRAVLERAHRNGCRVLVADAGRTYFDASGMRLLAKFTIDVPRDLEGVQTRTARVYEFLAR